MVKREEKGQKRNKKDREQWKTTREDFQHKLTRMFAP